MIALTAALTLFPSIARAVDLPLTAAQAQEALAAGAQVHGINQQTIRAFSEWNLSPEARVPVGTGVRVETPFATLFIDAADAAGRYETPSPREASGLVGKSSLTFTATLFSDGISDNDQATIVLAQNGRIFHPAHSRVRHTEPTRWFWQDVTADFDIAGLDLTRRFTVIVANCDVPNGGLSRVTELHFRADPTRFR